MNEITTKLTDLIIDELELDPVKWYSRIFGLVDGFMKKVKKVVIKDENI